ncbi:MAG: RagB/SusD family nutrient uptake outer membrane protein [Tannerellaceae bacterium]
MKKYIAALFIALSTTSCDDYLTVTPPTNVTDESISPEFADQTLQTLYNGAFYALTNWFNSYSYPGYRGTLIAVDALGNDMVGTSGIYGGVVTQYNFATNNTLGSNVNVTWRKYYNCIANCNKAIEFYNGLNSPSKTSKAMYAQLLALRSMCYLDIVRLWQLPYDVAKDYPVCPNMNDITEISEIMKGVKLSTVAEVYEVLIDDLVKAKEILTDEKYSKQSFAEMDAEVVSMFLARAYLTRGTTKTGGIKADMDAAVMHAASIRTSNKYTLMSTDEFVAGFNDAKVKEFMWGLEQTSSNNDMSYAFEYLDNRPGDTRAYYKNAVPDPYFKKLFDYGNGYDTNDIRFSLFEFNNSNDPNSTVVAPRVKDILTYTKFKFRAAEKSADLVYMRGAEAWLIEAEAKLRGGTGGTPQTAEQIIAELRQARNATTTGYVCDLDFVLKERRRELWGEGSSGVFDNTRTQSALVRKPLNKADFPEYPTIKGGHYTLTFPDKTGFVPNSPYYFFQIPEQEITNNPAVEGPLPRQ